MPLLAKEPQVDFTPYRAEQDLRIGNFKQKVSGYFRAEDDGQANCRISSYLQSMADRGYNSLSLTGLQASSQ